MAVAGCHRELKEPPVLGVPVDHIAVMDREEAAEHVLTLLAIERALDGEHREASVLIVGAAGVVLELVAQAWHHREADLHPGELLKQTRHVQVILRCVEPYPGKDELARLRMLVVGLVHMPDDRDGQLPVHATATASSRRRTNSGSSDVNSIPARGPIGLPMNAR